VSLSEESFPLLCRRGFAMPDAMIHPTPQELTAFSLGKLPERAAAAVASHLESCAACRQAVAGVTADSFLNKVRDAKQDMTALPPSLAQPQNAPSSAGRPAMPIVPCPNVPPELANHPKYLIRRELGRGGMGVVYQGWHKEMNRQIVIKVVHRALIDRPEALERFRREIQAAAQLSHRNIVTAHDAERLGELHMLVMEFVPGQSLAEVVEKKGPLPVRHACYYMHQTAAGLQYAYERGMVHRDIKPQNLMVTPKDQIKILDFGLAKVVRERDTDKGLTPSDACMGTAEYIAPEQAQNAAKADIRADLYSLGCTLYCLLAGRPPFREDTWMNTVLAHIQKEPPPLTELRPDVPERLWRVVARLMAKDPTQRYQKPSEVMAALAPFVIKPRAKPDAKSVAAPPPGVRSPGKGTKFGADSNEIKQVLQEVPGKAPPKQEPAKEEAASPFADVAVDASLTLARGPRQKRKKGCVLTAVVTVSLALALILMAGIISKIKEHQPNGNLDKQFASNQDAGKLKSPPNEAAKPEPNNVLSPPKKSSEDSGTSPKPPKQQDTVAPPEKKNNIEGKNVGNAQPKAAGSALPDDASVDDLRRALRSKDPAVQEMAAARLANLKDKAKPAMYALAETLTSAETPTSVRRNAALAIAHIGADAKPIVPALAQALNSSEPLDVRQFAAEALAKIRYPANEVALPAILKALENDNNPNVRQKCVWALFGLNDLRSSGADKVLAKVLDETGAAKMFLRYDAARKLAQALRENAPDKTVDILLEMLARAGMKVYDRTDVKVVGGRSEPEAKYSGDDGRYMAVEALAWLGDKAAKRPDVVEALRKAAKDKDEKLKEAAENALKELNIKE
jgi:serine/threonine protein kinase